MIDNLILENLASNEQYVRKVIPFMKKEYFSDQMDKNLFGVITNFITNYNSVPSREALIIECDLLKGISDDACKSLKETIQGWSFEPTKDLDWLVDQTEKFCQDKAIYNAIHGSIQILDGKDQKNDKGAIPQLLTDALAVTFDDHIGHDFLNDSEDRYKSYHKVEERIPFDLDLFNTITKGGLTKKTLNIALAGTGVGKSLFMCHCAASNLMIGKNVLYITLEMAEERIAERIDANLLNVAVDELALLPKESYDKKMARVKETAKGKLIIKEYPTASAGANNFRHLINELKTKKKFSPDIIYIDYLNICMSSRLKFSGSVNSYTYIKSIAEELRGLAVECNVPIVSATQTTRSGFTSSDVGLEDTSESFGLPATADLMFALISTEELSDMNQIMVKQLKSRYSDPNKNRRFIVGIDRAKMRLFNTEQSSQHNLVDGPAFDSTPSGSKMKFDKKQMFEDFN